MTSKDMKCYSSFMLHVFWHGKNLYNIVFLLLVLLSAELASVQANGVHLSVAPQRGEPHVTPMSPKLVVVAGKTAGSWFGVASIYQREFCHQTATHC